MTIDPLHSKLLDCAKAIEGGDLNLAEAHFKEIFQFLAANETKVASRKLVKYFAEALVRRIYKLYPRNPRPLVPCANLLNYRLHQFAPFSWFAEFTAMDSIGDAVIGKQQVHLIYFSKAVTWWQIHGLMQDLAKHPSGPLLSLRLTTIGPKLSKKGKYFQELHEQLTESARELHIDFKIRHLVANSAAEIVECTVKLQRTSEDETIVVRSDFELHKLLAWPGAIERVLSKLKDLKKAFNKELHAQTLTS